MKDSSPAFTLDRSRFSVAGLRDADGSLDFWLTQSPARRIEALEHLRRSFNPEAYSAPGLRRFFEATKRA
jgi:hypothetical protein